MFQDSCVIALWERIWQVLFVKQILEETSLDLWLPKKSLGRPAERLQID
jgi:hypothetical protein